MVAFNNTTGVDMEIKQLKKRITGWLILIGLILLMPLITLITYIDMWVGKHERKDT